MLRRCSLLNGDVIQRLAAPSLRRFDAIFVPNNWGLFDEQGRLIRESGYFRGPQPTLINSTETLPETVSGTIRRVSEEPRLFLGPVHAHYGHFLLATFSRLWNRRQQTGHPSRLLTYALPDIATHPYIEVLLNAVGLSTADCETFHEPVLVPNVVIPAPSFEETSFIHPEFGRLCHDVGDILTSHLAAAPCSRPFYVAKFALPRGVGRLDREEVIAEALARRGVDIVFPETMSLAEQVRLFKDRPGGIGLIGSAFHTAAFTRNKRFVCLTYGNQILSNQKLIDRGCEHETLYLHPPSGAGTSSTPEFKTIYHFEDPEAVAEDLLRVCDVVYGSDAGASRRGGAADVILPAKLDTLANLALGKTALQSSTAPQSFGNTRSEDASGALSGFYTGSFQFHTDFESDPWWQVDLGELSEVGELRLYNRLDQCAERANDLQISVSDDGLDFVPVLDVRCDRPFGGADGRPFCWRPQDPPIARFLRVTARGQTHLHLDQVAIYGRPAITVRDGQTDDRTGADDETIIGVLDHFLPPNTFIGWAVDRLFPEADGLSVEIWAGSTRIGRGTPTILREDLRQYGPGHYGYELKTLRAVRPSEFTGETLRVVARRRDGSQNRLVIGPHARAFTLLAEAAHLTASLDNVDEVPLRHALSQLRTLQNNTSMRAIVPFMATMQSRRSQTSGSEPANSVPSEPGPGSPLHFPIGFVSGDGSARLGRDGHVFLVGGSNEVTQQMALRTDDEIVQSRAEQWQLLIAERDRRIQPNRFLQVIIPEKMTVMPDMLDLAVVAPMPVLAEIERRVAAADVGGVLLSGRHALCRAAPGEAFRRLDTHFTPLGGYVMAAEIVRTLGFVPPPKPRFERHSWIGGDLSSRMTGVPLVEDVAFYHPADEDRCYKAREVISHFFPSNGGHIGRRKSWRNIEAQFPNTIMVFGNSFMDGDSSQSSIMYWIASWFRSVHFIFSPKIIYGDINAVKPSIVICQTIERFLMEVPTDDWEKNQEVTSTMAPKIRSPAEVKT